MHRRGKRPWRGRGIGAARLIAALSLLVAASISSAAPASASATTTLAAKLAQAQKIEAKIEAANKRADLLDEQYLDAKVAVATSQRKMAEAAARSPGR